jgi:hypothetical protein
VLEVRWSLEALTASLLAQADTRVVREQLGQPTTKGWLCRRFQLSGSDAGRLTSLADALVRWARPLQRRDLRAGGGAAHRQHPPAGAIRARLPRAPSTTPRDSSIG